MKTKRTSTFRRFKNGLFALLLPMALCTTQAQAQTILVNPATDGGFEMGTGSLTDNGWTRVAAAANDAWYTRIGTAGLTTPPPAGYNFPSNTRCAYISKDDGDSTWSYVTAISPNASHMYKTITVPAGQTQVVLSFQYQMNGTNNTKLMVYAAASNAVPTPIEPQSNGGTVSNNGWGAGTGVPVLLFSAATPQAGGTQTFTAPIPASFLNNCNNPTTFRLVFTSYRGSSGTSNLPPPAVDSISVISRTPVSAAPAIFTINNAAPTSGTNFNNFTDAITWVNAISACGIPNAITFNVSAGQTFNENTPFITASGTASKQIIFKKNGAGANPVIRPTGAYMGYQPSPTNPNPGTQDYGICLSGADYITFDGIDINSNNVSPTIAVEYGFLVKNASPTNGASNNTIKNTTILLDRTSFAFAGATPLTRGIVQTANSTIGGGITASTQDGANNNNSYYNLTIGNVQQGIVIYGSGYTLPDQNTKIGTLTPGTFNTIGRPGVPDDIGNSPQASVGINLNFQFDASVNNNIIQNITSTGNMVDGILIGSSSGFNGSGGFNNEVANNQILFLKSTISSASNTVTGMRINHDNIGALGPIGFKIYNNTVSNINVTYTGTVSATRTIRALWLPGIAPTVPVGVQYEIVNNTFIIDGSSAPLVSNTVFENGYASSVLKLRNNLFYNTTGAQTGAANHSVLDITGATTTIGTTGSLSNYNDFYYTNATGGFIRTAGSITSLATWRTTFVGLDANSISAEPKLNSTLVLYPLGSSPLLAKGPTLSPPYNRDIVNVLRAGNSSIGAFEKSGDIVAPVMADTTIIGINSTASRTLPALLKVTDYEGMVANTPGTAPRLYFKKSTNANVFGANNSSVNGWKWVEATNTTSPFEFTIDYALLTSSVAIHDVIQYFFVAQDTVVIPNLTAQPAAGFVGTSVGAITSAPTTPKSYVIYNTPATYVSSTTTQAPTIKVLQNSTNNAIIRVAVQTSATGDSAYVNAMNFTSGTSTDLSTIAAAKVWYTGTNATFNAFDPTNKQFGTTYITPAGSGALGALAFTGAQITPPNATVYFWLTYDIKSTATIGNLVDADAVSLMFDGVPQVPVVLSPAGTRAVKQAYCVPVPSLGPRHISQVTLNTLNNSVPAALPTPYYLNNAPIGTATTTLKRGLTYNLSLKQSTVSTSSVVHFDFNDNGTFDANESYTVSVLSGGVDVISTIPVTIPCSAVISSEIRMRVISYFTGSPWTNACTPGNGEIQDYTISIIDNAVEYTSSSTTQFSGLVAPSTTNKVMMQIPITAQGCGTGNLTEVYCHTAKTQNAATNITSAKLYSTGRSKTFTTVELLATATSPSGSFVFNGFSSSLSPTLGDTNYYWITYDMTSAAALNDTIDVKIDSMLAAGQYVVPSNNNPSEYLLVKAGNTYMNSNVIHPSTTRTPRTGQLYTPALRIRIVGTTTGAPLQLTQMNFDPFGGGNDVLNIGAARVFYTGNSATFNTATQFGSTYTAGTNVTGTKWNPFNITGSQDLNSDTNYFWLAYDMNSGASIVDSVDADLVSFTIGTSTAPTTKSVAGALRIKTNYCFMGPSGGNLVATPNSFEEITNVQFGSINNTSTCSQTGGIGSIVGQYSDYSDIIAPATVLIGDTVPFILGGISSCNQPANNNQNMAFVILIDWNQNGIFEAAEVAYRSATSLTLRNDTNKLFVPCNALQGNTRMRIIFGTGSNPNNTAILGNACGNTSGSTYLYGETEDYTINVQNNPVSAVAASVVQQTPLAGKGMVNVPIVRVALKTKGCGAFLNAANFSFTGTSLADISSIKLYSDTVNVFGSKNTLVGTVAPAANIQFSGLTTAFLNNKLTDSLYLWLTYDVALSATIANTLDARLDSILVGGTRYYTAATGNPAGSIPVVSRMTYTDATVTHPDLSSVAPGTLRKQILRVEVTGSANNGPIPITSLSFNVNGGGNNAGNIDSARVFYTGKSRTFAATNKFGNGYSAAPGTWGSFTITGDTTISDTANFWLVYDIKSGASTIDSVDAEFTGLTFDGALKTPTNGVPSGNVKIRTYCAVSSPGNVNSYTILTSVTIGGITNASGTTRPPNFYVDNTGMAARNVTKGPNSIGLTARDLQGGIGSFTYIYIDYDQNGDFTGPNEYVGSIVTPYDVPVTFNYNIPCNVKPGMTRMRVMVSMSNPAPSTCGVSATNGETEDYIVNIQESPLTFQMSTASQSSGTVGQGKNDQVMMNIKVKNVGCGIPTLTNMYFNTIGSTNPATDIMAAKLYRTGTNTIFNTSTLIGTVTSPNGPFNFSTSSINDILVSDDTTNYWLVYDVSPSATNNNTLDVRVDSIIAIGAQRIPNNNSPAEFKTILAPMTILDASASYPLASSDRVGQGASNYQAVCIRVVASAGGAGQVTAINFNTTNGGNDINTLTSAKVYYTGSNKNFATTKQFGTTYTAGSNVSGTHWLPFTVSGYQELAPDTNYFWLTFDVKTNATIGDSIDAEATSMVITAATQPITPSATTGNAIIRSEYCFPTGGSSLYCIDTAYVGTIYNATPGACAIYTNYSKTNPAWTTSVYAGSPLPIRLTFGGPTRASVFIDLNKNGIFEITEEFNIAPGFVPSVSTSIVIPKTAKLGETRMRIRTFYGGASGAGDRSCASWNQSEIEDYTITILPELPVATYLWNNAGTSDFTLASNWTPARSAASPTDVLQFNSPTAPLTISNVFTQTVASIDVAAKTVVNLNASGNAVIQVTGALTMGDTSRINGNSNIMIEIGESIGTPGSLTVGNASGIDAKIKRWVGPSNSANIMFPFRIAKGTRSLTLSYGFLPTSYGSVVGSFIPTKALGNFGFPLYDAGISSDLTKTCREGYWELAANDGLTGGVYSTNFSMDSIAFLPNPYNATVTYREDAFSPWTINGNHTGVSIQNATTTFLRATMQDFGTFTIASDSTQNSLPVTLTTFTATSENAGALVQWNTSSEVNNKGFDLERSVDGKSFKQVTFVKGNGTSTLAHNYVYNDEKAFTNTGSNILYYRLKQMDFDGKTTYSKVVKVASYMEQASTVSVYPNPFNDIYTVAIDLQNNAEITLVMTDIQGKTIASETLQAVKGNNNIPVSRFTNLEAGVYFLRITVGGESQVIKMIKK